LLLLTVSSVAIAQNPARIDTVAHAKLAQQYGPIYWFGADERYFPTLPFPTAFDGRDNNGDTLVDFQIGSRGGTEVRDLDEIAPLAPNDSTHALWDSLNVRYGRATGDSIPRIPPKTAIFYRVRTLSDRERGDMWRYLKSDNQIWLRFDKGLFSQKINRDTTTFQVIEYYALYLNDWGLIGHAYDTEPVLVFLPKHAPLAMRFRIVVGAGHTKRIPNNVLVLSGARAEYQIREQLNVLVELGDHSSAPDLAPYGSFNPGVDANWHVEDLWGTRDVQAASGRGFAGQYELGMTFPRDPDEVVRLFPPGLADSVKILTIQRQARRTHKAPREFTYTLLPVTLLETLSNQLAATEPDIDSVSASVDSIYGLLWPGANVERLSEEQLERLKTWNATMRCDVCGGKWFLAKLFNPGNIKPKKHQIWRSSHYSGPPTDQFKKQLFRPTTTELSGLGDYLGLLSYWITFFPGDVYLLQGGFIAPVPGGFPLRLPGFLESTFWELHAGIYTRCDDLKDINCYDLQPRSFAASVVVDGHYSRLWSWYWQLFWIPERAAVDANPDAADWIVGGGLRLLPFLNKRVAPLIGFSPRIRIGYHFDVRDWRFRFGNSGWEIQLSFVQY
jgi:hypothetical protein